MEGIRTPGTRQMSDKGWDDPLQGDWLRQLGIDQVEQNSLPFQLLMRREAVRICKAQGWVSIDELRVYGEIRGIVPHDPHAWGAIFKPDCFQFLAHTRSRIPAHHRTHILKWSWDGSEEFEDG